MRRYGIGLQLVLLVCCGVASGYIWHAALASKRASIRFVFIGRPYQPTLLAPSPRARPAFAHRRTIRRHVPAEATSSSGHVRRAAPAHAAQQPSPSVPQLASASAQSTKATTHPASRVLKQKDPSPPAKKDPTPRSTTPPAAPAPKTVRSKPPAPARPSPQAQVAATDKAKRPGWGHGDRNHDHTGPSSQALANPGQPSEPDQAKKPKPGK